MKWIRLLFQFFFVLIFVFAAAAGVMLACWLAVGTPGAYVFLFIFGSVVMGELAWAGLDEPVTPKRPYVHRVLEDV